MTNRFFSILLAATLLLSFNYASGQNTNPPGPSTKIIGQEGNAVTTAVPFLIISPDARSGALGDAGVAISPDANAIYWNPAKLSFLEKKVGGSFSYTPWLRNLVTDMSISTLSGYYKVDKNQAVGLNLTYFNLGSIDFTDVGGLPQGSFNPREFAFGSTYSRRLSDNLGLAVGLRYIHSNLAAGYTGNSASDDGRAGNSVAGDVAVYYTKDLNVSGRDMNLSLGANLSNIGGKISYSNRNNREFLPTNLRFGPALTYNVDPYNKFTFTIEANKILAPTPNPADTTNATKTFISGALGSFSDAPGGFKEELREFIIASGVEYWYNDLFAARAGYFSENRYKGNRKYFTIGVGIRYQKLGFDFAYLIPQQRGNNNPLAETLRFTLHINFENDEVADTGVTE